MSFVNSSFENNNCSLSSCRVSKKSVSVSSCISVSIEKIMVRFCLESVGRFLQVISFCELILVKPSRLLASNTRD
jgi:hypothetical protein